MSGAFVSLMYHNVVSDDPAAARAEGSGLSRSITSYWVSASDFSRHLETISSTTDILTSADLQRFYTHDPELAERTRQHPLVQLTFDDGWRGTVDIAGPLLAKRGLQALLFVTTGLIGAPRFLAAAELSSLPRETFHVGSHTVSHPFLNELDDEQVADELRRSKDDLEDIVGYEVDSVSIPNGASDARVIRIAADCGYRFIHTSDVHRNTRGCGPLAIGRIAIRDTTTNAAIARYACGDLRNGQWRSRLLALPKHILGPARYRRLRESLLGQRHDENEMCDLFHASHARESTVLA
ncbi:MAG: polysaccharide deacetylase family protein [Planctomycetaceae bacterium]